MLSTALAHYRSNAPLARATSRPIPRPTHWSVRVGRMSEGTTWDRTHDPRRTTCSRSAAVAARGERSKRRSTCVCAELCADVVPIWRSWCDPARERWCDWRAVLCASSAWILREAWRTRRDGRRSPDAVGSWGEPETVRARAREVKDGPRRDDAAVDVPRPIAGAAASMGRAETPPNARRVGAGAVLFNVWAFLAPAEDLEEQNPLRLSSRAGVYGPIPSSPPG
jgi:hypothetical protein